MAGSPSTRLLSPPMSPPPRRLLSPGASKLSEVNGQSPSINGISPVKDASSPQTLLDARESVLLAHKLRTTEAALDDERALGDREREVLRERLRFAESQDEAARERLAVLMASLRIQNDELHGSLCHAAEEDKEKQAAYRNEYALYEDELQQAKSKALLAFEEVRQASADRDRLAANLQRCNADEAAIKDAKMAEHKRLESALQRREQELDECKSRAALDLSRATAEHRQLQEEVHQLQRQSEASRRDADLKAEQQFAHQAVLEAQRDAKHREYMDLEARQRQEHAKLEDAMNSRLAALQAHLELECQAKDRLRDSLAAEVTERSRRLAALTEEVAGLTSHEHSEAAAVDRLECDFQRRMRASSQDEAASLSRIECREREAIAELRAQARSELRLELHDAEAASDAAARSAMLRGEVVERERQAELRSEILNHSGDAEWRLRSLYDDEVRSASATKASLVQLSESREKELLHELRQARDSKRDLEQSHDAKTAALQQSAARERELHSERIERLRGELHSELRDQRQTSEQHLRQLLDSSERAAERAADRRERSMHAELHSELRRLRDQVDLMAQHRLSVPEAAGSCPWDTMGTEGGHGAMLDLKRRLEDLASLCRQHEDTERQLRFELSDMQDRKYSNGILETRLQDAADAARQSESAMRAHFESTESRESMMRTTLQSELADAQSNRNREADVAKSATSRCSALEHELQDATLENTNLRHRLHHLEAELSALSQLGADSSQQGLAIREECRWRSMKLENALNAAEAEAQAAKADAQQSALELHRAVGATTASQVEESRVCDRVRSELRQSNADLQEARAAERLALQDLKRSEEKRRRDLVSMDALVADTRILAQSLGEHQHLADGLNQMIKRHEVSISRTTSPVRSGHVSPRSGGSPALPSSTVDMLLNGASSRLSERLPVTSPPPRRELLAGSSTWHSERSVTSSTPFGKEPLSASSTRLSEKSPAISPYSGRGLLATSSSRLPDRLSTSAPASAGGLASAALRAKESSLSSSLGSETVVGGESLHSRQPTSASLSSTVVTSRVDAPSNRLHVSPPTGINSFSSTAPLASSTGHGSESLANWRLRESQQACRSALSLQSATDSSLRMSSAAVERNSDKELPRPQSLTDFSRSVARQCPVCGNTYMPDSKFCRKCGTERRCTENSLKGSSTTFRASSAVETSSMARQLEQDRMRRSLSPSCQAPRRSLSPSFQAPRRSEQSWTASAITSPTLMSASREGKRVSWGSVSPSLSGQSRSMSTPSSRRKLFY